MSKKESAKTKKQASQTQKPAKQREKQQRTEHAGVVVRAADSQADEPEDDEDDDITLDVAVTRETLDGTPLRVLTFLKAIGTSAAIHAAMTTRGYNREQHLHGWALLHAVSGYQDVALPVEDTSVRDAIKELDDWDEDGFQIIAASLKYRYPEQAAFLLTGLGPTTGAAAVLGVKQLLDRLAALESGTDRQSARQKDEAALALLAQRGIDKKQRSHLGALIATAESAPEISLPDAETVSRSEASYLKGLMALRAWFEEWSGIARVAIKRRDHLIRLGLARRRAHNGASASPAKAEASTGA